MEINMQSKWTKWIIGGIAGLLLLVGVLAALNITRPAQTATAAHTPDRAVVDPATMMGQPDAPAAPLDAPLADRSLAGPGIGHGMGFGEFDDDSEYMTQLANELGITLDQLKTAHIAAVEAVIQQRVTNGTISQEQADLMLAAFRLKHYIDQDALKAEALGITVAELEAARTAGKTLDEVLDEQGMDRATYRENLAAAYDAAIDQAVADGIITSEQAEQLRNRSSDDNNGGGRGPGRMPGQNL